MCCSPDLDAGITGFAEPSCQPLQPAQLWQEEASGCGQALGQNGLARS